MPNDRRTSPVYAIRETTKAQAQLDELAGKHSGFVKLWENGICWLIQRNPAAGVLIPGKQQTYVIKTEDFLAINLPIILVTYSVIDSSELIVEIIEVVEIPIAEGNAVAKLAG